VKVIDTCGLEDPEGGDSVNYTVSEILTISGRGLRLVNYIVIKIVCRKRVEFW
jgi:hypothetical protein